MHSLGNQLVQMENSATGKQEQPLYPRTRWYSASLRLFYFFFFFFFSSSSFFFFFEEQAGRGPLLNYLGVPLRTDWPLLFLFFEAGIVPWGGVATGWNRCAAPFLLPGSAGRLCQGVA
ncbi:MAG: hypothetical protein AB2556_25010 [Candidatus Thiodiazotropha sp.]